MPILKPFARVHGWRVLPEVVSDAAAVARAVIQLARLCYDLQENVARVIEALKDAPLLECREIDDLVFDGTNFLIVAHGLGRPYRGMIVKHQTANGTVRESVTVNPRPDQFIRVIADAAMTAGILVY